MQGLSFICAFINASWIMAVIKMMNCLGRFLKKLKGRSFLDVRSLRDITAANTIASLTPPGAFFFLKLFCFVSEGKCLQAPTSLDFQKINSVDDVETIAYKVNEILLKAG